MQNSGINASHECVLDCFTHVWLFTTPWTVACQSPLSMGFSRQYEYWSRLSFPPPRDLPHPGMELHILNLLYWQVGSLPLVRPRKLSLPRVIFSFYRIHWIAIINTQRSAIIPHASFCLFISYQINYGHWRLSQFQRQCRPTQKIG